MQILVLIVIFTSVNVAIIIFFCTKEKNPVNFHNIKSNLFFLLIFFKKKWNADAIIE